MKSPIPSQSCNLNTTTSPTQLLLLQEEAARIEEKPTQKSESSSESEIEQENEIKIVNYKSNSVEYKKAIENCQNWNVKSNLIRASQDSNIDETMKETLQKIKKMKKQEEICKFPNNIVFNRLDEKVGHEYSGFPVCDVGSCVNKSFRVDSCKKDRVYWFWGVILFLDKARKILRVLFQ